MLRGLLVAIVVLAALPQAASAQASDPDSYLFPYFVNDPGTSLPTESPGPGLVFVSNTTGAGTQADLFNPPGSGGIGESTGCQLATVTTYGATEWWRFHPHRNGGVTLRVQGVGFRPVIAIMPVGSDGNPVYSEGVCLDASSTTNEAVLGQSVSQGRIYAIQVGGATNASGAPGQGEYNLKLYYDPDSDGDGLLDSGDDCKDQAGEAAHKGCPDSDRDGIRDRDDACSNAAGEARYQGCPDSDGDGIPLLSDRCPTAPAGQAGTRFGGCPDDDGDGVPEDGSDDCRNVNPARVDREDRNPRDGCPDLLRISANLRHLLGPRGNGVAIKPGPTGFQVINVPRGARVEMRCKRPGGSNCGRLTVKRAATASIRSKVRAQAARTVSIRRRLPGTLPYGTVITVSVTARYAIGRYIRATIVRGDLISKKFLCIPAGKKKPRKRGGCR